MNAALLTAMMIVGPTPAMPATTAAETFTIDTGHSMALFRVQHQRAGAFWGRFNTVTGTIDFDETAGEVSFDVTIDVSSVDTGNRGVDEHLVKEDFFYVEQHPSITFKSTSAKKKSDKMFEVTGELMMRGVTKTVTVPVELIGIAAGRRGKKCGFEAVVTVKRSDFGISYGVESGALGDETRLIVAMEAGASSGERGGGRRGGG
jgi:polyisoprenoid-binding protein YceI